MFSLTINGRTFNYVMVETNAPKSYDYSNVIEIKKYGHLRYILIVKDKKEYQCMRYSSGNFYSKDIDIDLFGESEIAECIMRKLSSNTEG